MFRGRGSCQLVNHDTYSDAEVVLSGISNTGWVVVELNRAHVQSITHAKVQPTSQGSCQTRLGGVGILQARRRKNCDTEVVAKIDFIPDSRAANQGMCKGLNTGFLRIVFQLHPA